MTRRTVTVPDSDFGLKSIQLPQLDCMAVRRVVFTDLDWKVALWSANRLTFFEKVQQERDGQFCAKVKGSPATPPTIAVRCDSETFDHPNIAVGDGGLDRKVAAVR